MGSRAHARASSGFSLIELLIVVAIILIIAAIAIPNLLRARISANESAAVQATRTLTTAQIQYQAAYPTIGYGSSLLALGGAQPCAPSSATACIIDDHLTTGSKEGYVFTVTAAGVGQLSTYAAGGKPGTSSTGNRSFCSIEDAVVRVSATDFASAVDGSACASIYVPLGN